MFFKKKLLLLDEPTSALSVRETNAFLDYITHLRDEGMSVVLVTHSIYHAFQVADRFVLYKPVCNLKSMVNTMCN